MILIGAKLTVLSSTDPTKAGLTGEVVLDRANTLVFDSLGKRLVVEKQGSVFQLYGTKQVFVGADLLGRYEDRLRSTKR